MEQSPSNMPVMESKSGVAGWFSVWMKAVSKPSEQSFIEITESPEAKTQTALIWIFAVGTIAGLVSAVVQTISAFMGGTTMPAIPGLEEYIDPSMLQQTGSPIMTFVVGVCVSPIAGAVSVLFFALFTAITQWIAKLFGGTGSFEKVLYAFAAISVPFTLVSSILSMLSVVPWVGTCFSLISLGVSVYVIVLQVYAIKAVNRFESFGPAVGAVLIPVAVLFLVFCICIAVFAFMIGGQGFAL